MPGPSLGRETRIAVEIYVEALRGLDEQLQGLWPLIAQALEYVHQEMSGRRAWRHFLDRLLELVEEIGRALAVPNPPIARHWFTKVEPLADPNTAHAPPAPLDPTAHLDHIRSTFMREAAIHP